MHIICDSQVLVSAVSNVQRAVTGKSTLPALEGILLRAKENALFLAGYDLDLGITTSIEAEVRQPGEIVLSAKLFSDICRSMPSETVSIRSDEKGNVTIESGVTRFTIVGISAEEYPDLPSVGDGGMTFTLPQNTVKSMIRQTIFAIAQGGSPNPIYTGTKFEVEDGCLRLISVDGSRLALRCESIRHTEKAGFVVPGKTLQEMIKLLGEEDTPMSMVVGQRHVIMDINGYAVISRLLAGEFLAYRNAIPKQVTATVRVKTRTLMELVERASLVINDRVKSPLLCRFADNKIDVSCITSIGSVIDYIDADIDGADTEMGFNSRFLLDALKNCEADEVKMELGGPTAPLKIMPPEGESFLFLVMPVRMKK